MPTTAHRFYVTTSSAWLRRVCVVSESDADALTNDFNERALKFEDSKSGILFHERLHNPQKRGHQRALQVLLQPLNFLISVAGTSLNVCGYQRLQSEMVLAILTGRRDLINTRKQYVVNVSPFLFSGSLSSSFLVL